MQRFFKSGLPYDKELQESTDYFGCLTKSLGDADKEKIEEMVERIRVKEKYELLAKRDSYADD